MAKTSKSFGQNPNKICQIENDQSTTLQQTTLKLLAKLDPTSNTTTIAYVQGIGADQEILVCNNRKKTQFCITTIYFREKSKYQRRKMN